MNFKLYKKITFVAGLVFLFGAPLTASYVYAANVGDVVNFNVDKRFDLSGRNQVPATLVKLTDRLYFYVETNWWNQQTPVEQSQALIDLDNLSAEFDGNIYPKLTSLFGSEWNPGIDNDSKITVLFESINSAEGGYFREDDEYDKLQIPGSNQREMLYLSVSHIGSPDIKIVLAHEFVHLITFNQKNKIFGVEEDTWLNEARSVYSSTALGYDDVYGGSNLQQRVEDFIGDPSDSITDWSGSAYDYASVDLFMQYLVDHYGVNILSDSMKTKSVGIASINESLAKANAKENFAQVFTNWTITLAVNDCSLNQEYCYLNQNLSSLKISPTLIFLPLTGSSSLSTTDVTKNWSGNWQKIIGGSGDLKLDFSSLVGLNFQVPYILYDKSGNYSVGFLVIDNNGKGEINIKDFGTNYKSLVIIPSLQSKLSGFDVPDLIYPYSFTVSIAGQESKTDQDLIQKLLAQIDSLKKQIAAIQSGVAVFQNNQTCVALSSNLYIGVSDIGDVKCLQQFLKKQGQDIYPEGIITGNFGVLTKAAVIRFQSKYNISQTGFVGILTRTKINQLMQPAS